MLLGLALHTPERMHLSNRFPYRPLFELDAAVITTKTALYVAIA